MTKALSVKEKKVQTVSDVLSVAMTDIKDVIPTFLSPERLMKVFISQCKKTPKLLDCDATSLVKAFTDAGEIGLEPDGIHAHLIPYGKEVNYMVDYKGMIKLARLSGEIADMTANVVYTEDVFSHEYGSNKHLKHIKCMKKKRGVRMCAYSYVKYKDGSEDFRVLTEEEIMHAKKSSKTAAIWDRDPDPMWAKTAVRQHSKFLPRLENLSQASQYVEATELREITDNDNLTALTNNNKGSLVDKIKEQKDKQLPKPETKEETPETDTPKPDSELADGDFKSEILEYANKNKCEKDFPEALSGMGFASLDEVVEQNFTAEFTKFFTENYPK